jgi:hypothetical protein
VIGVAMLLAVVLAVAVALAASAITKHQDGFLAIPAGQTRTLTVPFPDALEYGNARYSGRAIVVGPWPNVKRRTPDLKKVKIISAGSVEGGSAYQARARNDNRPGTAPVRLEVIATTVEPLPHS